MAMKNLRELERKIFRQNWVRFPEEIEGIENVDSPGVYVIALNRSNLVGERVRESEVSYVGMSNSAGLRKRLKCFQRGLKKGRGHSAANKLHGKRMRGRRCYAAAVGVPCNTKKKQRKSNDLKTMGLIAALEMFVLARVKRKTGKEPEMNTK